MVGAIAATTASSSSWPIAHDGRHLGALALVITQRPTHYERVTCVARKAATLKFIT